MAQSILNQRKWIQLCEDWVKRTLKEQGTLAWDFKRGKPRSVWGFDDIWMFNCIREANFREFEHEEGDGHIDDLCKHHGIKDYKNMSYIEKIEAIYKSVRTGLQRSKENTVKQVWNEFQSEMRDLGLVLNIPDEFIIPYEEGDPILGCAPENWEEEFEEEVPF